MCRVQCAMCVPVCVGHVGMVCCVCVRVLLSHPSLLGREPRSPKIREQAEERSRVENPPGPRLPATPPQHMHVCLQTF